MGVCVCGRWVRVELHCRGWAETVWWVLWWRYGGQYWWNDTVWVWQSVSWAV